MSATGPIEGIKGLRHVALRVTDIARSQAFYETFFGMKVVWQPDAENVYLSSGSDNLALHQIAKNDVPLFRNGTQQVLDHLGFIMESPSLVDRFFERVEKAKVTIVHRPKGHRDGSYSFYLADPDGNTVQVLYEPNLSNKKD